MEVNSSSADVEEALAVSDDADAIDLEEFISLGVVDGVEVELVLEAGTAATLDGDAEKDSFLWPKNTGGTLLVNDAFDFLGCPGRHRDRWSGRGLGLGL